MQGLVNWNQIEFMARARAGSGPTDTPVALRGLVKSLRRSAQKTPPILADITGLEAAAEAVATKPVLVLDRPTFAAAAVQTGRALLGDLLSVGPGKLRAVTGSYRLGWSAAAAAQSALGVYDPYHRGPLGRGRLLLVAPNILRIEQETPVDAFDFRTWVCVRELTHALHSQAAPWLTEYLEHRLRELMLRYEGPRTTRLLTGEIGPRTPENSTENLTVQARETDYLREELVAVLALLEGHTRYVMGAITPRQVPSIKRLRTRFTTGNEHSYAARILGLTAASEHYQRGHVLVDTAIDRLGLEGFNQIWQRRDLFPTAAELLTPSAWAERLSRE